MKAVRLAELRSLTGSPEFQGFWGEVRTARAEAERAAREYEEALTHAMVADFRAELAQKNGIDTLYAAGEAEDTGARLSAESSTLENRGLDLVGAYEDQRYAASEAWYRLNAAERSHEERRDAAEAAGAGGDGKVQAELARLERARQDAQEAYEREEHKKQALWEDVERQWARSTELDLLVREKEVDARRVRRQAEALFQDAERRKKLAREEHDRVDALSRRRAEAERRVEELLRSARDRVGAVATRNFLYYRCAENRKLAYAVALFADDDDFNVQVGELQVYRVDRERGVSFLEPAFDAPPPEEGETRFEQWFLTGRKGRTRSEREPTPAAEVG